MVFSSTVFLFVFFPLVLLIYFNPLVKGRRFRNDFLFAASLFFYAWGEPLFVFVMCLSILVTWGVGLWLTKRHTRGVLAVGVVYHLALLFVYKYLSFFSRELGLLLHREGMVLHIALPIGISFFTFQMISYLVDIYHEPESTQRNPIYVGLYSVLFPQLIAGPIVRYRQIAHEIDCRTESWDEAALGMKRFIYGLGKKVLLANFVAQGADNIFAAPEKSAALAWLGLLFYGLQIYYDFSGYSDMAIGLGRIFGFHFEENFRYPYASHSVTEFWRRWHISLGAWFRDYVYIPLGGNRVSPGRNIFNIFAVWLLTGIWHGANWTYLAWGLFYFALLVMEKKTGLNKGRTVFHWLYTMLMVTLSWALFRSDTLADALRYFGCLFGVGTSAAAAGAAWECLRGTWLVLLVACVGVFPVAQRLPAGLRAFAARLENLWCAAVFLCALLQVVSSTYNPFIYFNF